MKVPLAQFEGFYWVAKLGSYSRAARNFPYPISQPGVYKQVQRLEEALEVELLVRTAHDTMSTTVAGRYLFDFVAPFFERLPKVLKALQEDRHQRALRIEASTLVVRHFLPKRIQRLITAVPDAEIALEEPQDTDLKRLRSHEVDLLIDFVPDLPEGLRAVELTQARAFLVAPRAFVGTAHWCAKDLSHYSFITYVQTLKHHALQRDAAAAVGIQYERVLHASSADSILSFVSAGLGYSLIPWLDDHGPKVAGVAAKRLEHPGLRFPISAVWAVESSDHPLLEPALAAFSAA